MNSQIGARMNSQPLCLNVGQSLEGQYVLYSTVSTSSERSGAELILFEAGFLNFDEFRCADNTWRARRARYTARNRTAARWI
jgi:hypothetical protein